MRDRGSARVSSVRRVNCLRSPITTIGASADRADSRNGYYADRNVNSPRMSRSALETRVTAHVRGGYKGGERLLGGDSRRDSLRREDTSPANWAQPIRVSQEPILGPGGCAGSPWDACATSSSVSRPVGPAAGTATAPFILKLLRRQGRALQESAAEKKRGRRCSQRLP